MTQQGTSLIGHTLDGRYRIVAHLADGGMGSIYRAQDLRLERHVAVKVLRPELAQEPRFVERFRKEALVAARLSHPHVVSVYDQGDDGPHVFLIMELIEGRTLRDILNEGSLPVRHALELFDQMLDGLSAAHQAGLVHLDIKPENVLVSPYNYVKVADFGLARAVTDGQKPQATVYGTASYLAPEQITHGPLGPYTDVYSAGLVLYELLTGERAFTATPHDELPQIVDDAPVPSQLIPALGPYFDDIVALACERDPYLRLRDAAALRERIEKARTNAPSSVLEHITPARTAEISSRSNETVDFQRTAQLGSSTTQAFGGPQRPIAPRRRRRWIPLAVFATLAVFSALALAWAFFFGPWSPHTIPNVAGQTRENAAQTLRHSGFGIEVKTEHSDSVPTGQAIDTVPASGQKARSTQTIVLEISTGPQMVTVPSVSGLNSTAATNALRKAGLVVGATIQQPSRTAIGQALNVTPGTGTVVKHGTSVTLIISSGAVATPVPDVTGRSTRDATAELENAGFQVTVQSQPSDTVNADQTITTSPAPNSTAYTGDTITIIRSSGKQQVSVPNIVGMSVSDANNALDAAGLSLGGNSWFDELANHHVQSQDPAAGTQVDNGSTVNGSFG